MLELTASTNYILAAVLLLVILLDKLGSKAGSSPIN